jgi:hypothetical protein
MSGPFCFLSLAWRVFETARFVRYSHMANPRASPQPRRAHRMRGAAACTTAAAREVAAAADDDVKARLCMS